MTVFDPETFISTAPEEELDTEYQPCPEGEWHAVIEDLEVREVISQKTGETYPVLDVHFRVINLPEDVKAETGLDEPRVRGSIFLRLTPEGKLDPRRNQQLGRLYRAVGVPSTSPMSALKGAGPCIIRVKHRTSDTGEVFADATAWRPLE